MSVYTIKDLENLSGIKAHTIRIWEQRYSLIKPQRTDTNIRYYSNDELKALLNISLLNKYGYKISQINKMTAEEISNKILTLDHVDAAVERIVNDLVNSMIALDHHGFEHTINDCIFATGIEEAITSIVFPLMEKIGLLWQTNHINPAQEHLISNIIRQKLIAGIDQVKVAENFSPSVCCFLPEGEYHELGLLFMHFLMKSRGINVIYLGAAMPLDDLETVVTRKKADYIYSHLTSVNQHFNFERFIRNLISRFPSAQIVLSGNVIKSQEKKLPKEIIFKRSYQEVLALFTTQTI